MVAAPSPAPALTLEALQLVDAIARHGSFGRAARALGRVPSAVTYSVRRLEDDLDVLLFDRRGHKAQLTPAGEELLREGRHLLTAADDLVRRVQRVARGWEQELRIALDGVIAFERLLPYLTRFCTLAPTQVRITHEVLGGTWDALGAGRADIGIGATHGSPPTTFLGVPYRTLELGRVAFVFAVAPTHPLAALAEPLPIAELRRHRQIVVADTSQQLSPRTAGLFGALDILTVPTMQAKIAAQAAGLGVGYLPEPLARSAIARRELVVKQTDHTREDGAVVDLQIAWRTDARGKALAWWQDQFRTRSQRAALLD
jgi:DNA-binding transcriptional LysR family regulator